MVGGKLVVDLRLRVRSMLLQIYFTGEPETLICNDSDKISTVHKKTVCSCATLGHYQRSKSIFTEENQK